MPTSTNWRAQAEVERNYSKQGEQEDAVTRRAPAHGTADYFEDEDYEDGRRIAPAGMARVKAG